MNEIVSLGLARIKKSALELIDEEIVGREEQKRGIESNIDVFIQSPCTRILFINGTPGTGKTMMVQYLLKKHQNEITTFFFNAIKEKSIINICLKVGGLKKSNSEEKVMERLLKRLDKIKNGIIVIDEYDVLMNDEGPLYRFFDWIFNKSPLMMLILISNNSQYSQILHSRVASRNVTFNYNFYQYTSEEIKNILLKRIGEEVIYEIFNKKDFDYFINERIEMSLQNGDVRKALGMMFNILLNTKERIEKGEDIKLSHQKVNELITSNSSYPTLNTCSQMELLILYCIMKCKEEEYGYESVMKYLDGIRYKKSDLINWNEFIVKSCISRLEKKELISISSNEGKIKIKCNEIDKDMVLTMINSMNNITSPFT
ncbi:hypothetical protein ENUP19_0130G0045 [Entamoeba nuttalli]|uniref:Origin recognition complex subunit 1 n=1 Tax=Entamoeba nuttalli TaxID=412467 RepID=A0ABQ0DA35_9EUKA